MSYLVILIIGFCGGFFFDQIKNEVKKFIDTRNRLKEDNDG